MVTEGAPPFALVLRGKLRRNFHGNDGLWGHAVHVKRAGSDLSHFIHSDRQDWHELLQLTSHLVFSSVSQKNYPLSSHRIIRLFC